MQFLKNMVSNMGYSAAPFGFAPGQDPYQAGLQYIGDIGTNMLASGETNPLRAFGRASIAAKEQAADYSRQRMAQQMMMDSAEEKRKEREAQAQQQAMMEEAISQLPPDQQAMARMMPEKFFGEQISQQFATRGTPEFGLNPIALADENGEFVGYGQMSKAGGLFYNGQDVTSSGLRPMDPNALAFEKSSGATQGKTAGTAAGDLPGARKMADYVKLKVNDIINDPNLPDSIGWTSMLPDAVAPSNVINFRAKLSEIQGEAFLQARTMLKGGGQITDFESQKAEAAYSAAVTAIKSSDPQALKDALGRFKEAIDQGIAKLEAQSGQGAPSGGFGLEDPLGLR